jgi:tryptophan 2,3-dioxygenase
MASPQASSYGDYLRVPELLGLQRTLSGAHDELQFIIVHQAFELWFKLLIFELEALRGSIDRDDAPQALHYLERIREIVKLLISSFGVIETMRPYDFLEFRNLLQPASGFQSLQFREIEFLSGAKDDRYLKLFKGETGERLARRFREPTIWDAYVGALKRQRHPINSDAEIVRAVIEVLKQPDRLPMGPLTEALIEYDEIFSMWRARHIAMVMRMIGSRPGTGQASVTELVSAGYGVMGSGGVDYLKTTSGRVFFPLLWEARTFIQR